MRVEQSGVTLDPGDDLITAASLDSLRPGRGPSSIGRWKRDLEPRLQKICDEAFDGLLDELDGAARVN